jgi:hypothetical protein
MSQELIDKIRAASQAKGVDPEVALRIARAESGLKVNATPGTSTAGGLFQVVDKTWKEFGGAPGKKFDPDENIRVGTDIIAKNAQTLKSFLNRDPRPAELYAAHYFGPSGAKSFLSAEPGTPMESLFPANVIKANPNLKGKTSDQVMASLEKKMGGKPAAPTVSRETSAPAAAPSRALPPSLPPMAAAGTATVAAAPMKEQVASLGPGYQAALALSFLADTDEKEDRDVEKEPGIAEKWLAQTASRPAAMAQFADISIKSPFAEPEQPQQPLMFNKGGEVTAEELAAASRPATVNPNIRRQGEAARRLAAMRDVNTLPDPRTYAAVSGFLGQAPDEMGFSALHPDREGIKRAGQAGFGVGTALQVAPIVGQAAKMLGKMTGSALNERMLSGQSLTPGFNTPAPINFAVKPRGGTFAYTPEDTARAKPISELGKLIQEYGTEARDLGAGDEVLEFLKAKAPKYFTSSYGTADDPLRTAFRDRRIEPFGRDREKIKPYLVDAAANPEGRDQLGAKIDLERAYDDRTGVRAFALKSEDSPISFERDMGRSISAKMGEEGVPIEARNLPDLNAYSPSEFELYPTSSTMLRRLVENQEKLPTNLQQALRTGEPMYDVRPELALLKPTSVIEALQEVPANKLKNMSFPEALIQGTQALAPVRDYLAAITLAEKGAKVPRKALDMFTTPVAKAPSFGGQWVTLDKSVAAKMEGKLMNHSVGDYNSGTSYGTAYTDLPYGGKKAFDEGLVRVYSLRDAEGLPKVTVEMAKSDGGKGNTWNVSQIRGRFNSEPMPEARDDIFRLLNKIDSQDGLATVKTNGYARSATGESVPSTEINWGKEYDLWKQSAE